MSIPGRFPEDEDLRKRVQELEHQVAALMSIVNQHIDLGDTMSIDERIDAARAIARLKNGRT